MLKVTLRRRSAVTGQIVRQRGVTTSHPSAFQEVARVRLFVDIAFVLARV